MENQEFLEKIISKLRSHLPRKKVNCGSAYDPIVGNLIIKNPAVMGFKLSNGSRFRIDGEFQFARIGFNPAVFAEPEQELGCSPISIEKDEALTLEIILNDPLGPIKEVITVFEKYYSLATAQANDSELLVNHTAEVLTLPKAKPSVMFFLNTVLGCVYVGHKTGDVQAEKMVSAYVKNVMNDSRMDTVWEILVAEDDKSMLESFKRILRAHLGDRKYNIETALNGNEALKKVKSKKQFSYIITDYRMPVLNGIDFYKELRNINPEQQKSVFMFTGDNVTELKGIVNNSLEPGDYAPLPVFSKSEAFGKIGEILKPFFN